MRASRDTEGRCDAAFVIPWKARAAGVSREGGGLGEGSRGMRECGLRRCCCVASRNVCSWRHARSAGRCCGARSGVWECDRPSCGAFVVHTPEQQVRLMRPHKHGMSGLPGVHRSGRKVVVPERLCVVSGSGMARSCVWRDPASGHVLARVRAGLATTRRTGGRCRCVLAMGNSVAPVVHLAVEHRKDSQCAALTQHSGAECE